MGSSLKTLICSYLAVNRQVVYFCFCVSLAYFGLMTSFLHGIYRSYSNLIRMGNVCGFIVIGWRR